MGLKTELLKFGLSQKEADVYMALMELGFGTVQQIAQKSGVNRATTYVILDSLKEKGLSSIFEKEKKVFYASENPNNLLNYLSAQERALHEKRKELQQLLPDLLGVFNLAQNKPIVKYYEGQEALNNLRKEFFRGEDKVMRSFYPYDLFCTFTQEGKEVAVKNYENLVAKGYTFRFLISIKNELKDTFEKEYFKDIEYCLISESDLPLNSEIGIMGNKMVVYRNIMLEQKLGSVEIGIILDDASMVKNYTSIFDMIWKMCVKK